MRTVKTLLFILLILCGIFYQQGYGIRFNLSDSLPYSLFFSMPVKYPLHYGQIIAFNMQKSPVTFAKTILGLPKDRLSIQNNCIYINDSNKGCLIEGFVPIEEGVIPEGFYFVMGSHPESFDSRYREFGLVPQSSIKECLWPIL